MNNNLNTTYKHFIFESSNKSSKEATELLNNKLLNSNNNFKKLVSKLEKKFKKIEKETSNWVEDFEIDTIKEFLIDINDEIINSIIQQISRFDNLNDLENLYLDIIQYISYKKTMFKSILDFENIDIYEKIVNYDSFVCESKKDIIKSVEDILILFIDNYITILNRYEDKFNKIREDEDLSLDDKREQTRELFHKILKKTDKNLKNTNLSEIDEESRSKSKINNMDIDNLEVGTKIKYTQLDGTENTAEVATNQEDVPDDYIKLISNDGKDKFLIKHVNIIGITDKDGDILVTPDYIENNINDILDDNTKMRKLKKFLDNL